MRTRLIVNLLALTSLTSFAYAMEPDPKQILDKVAARYQSMQTYQSEGTVLVDMETENLKAHMETAFFIKLKKPNLYLITWTQKNMPMPGMEQSGAVWNAGDGPYLYSGVGTHKTYSKESSDEMALAGATGISQGAAHTIASLFLQTLEHSKGRVGLLSPKVERTEKLGDEECYVITGKLLGVGSQTYWIATKSHLVMQVQQSIEPAGTRSEMTDQQLEEITKARGGGATKEETEKLKETMKSMQEMMPNMKMTSLERHVNISSPELSQEDFRFKVPEGTVLKESRFDEASDEKNTPTAEMSEAMAGAGTIRTAIRIYAAQHGGSYPTLTCVKGDALAASLGLKKEDLDGKWFKAASFEVTSTPTKYTIKATLGAETYIINQDGVESGTYRTSP